MQTITGQSVLTSRQVLPKQLSRAAVQSAPATRRHNRVVSAQRDSSEGAAPSGAALKAFSVLAAAQLALLPVSAPAEAFNLFPKTGSIPSSIKQAGKQLLPDSAQSESARDALNKKTDNLPSLKQTGQELFGGSDPLKTSSAQDVGKAINNNTPNLDLTRNPKDLAGDVKGAVKNSLPDLSEGSNTSQGNSAQSDNANLPNAGPISKAAEAVGKKVVSKLPNAPDLSNPKGSAESGFPTIPKVAKANPLQDVSEAQYTDNKPNFPLPNVPGETSQNQDVFKQLGDKARDIVPGGAPNPGKLGDSLAKNSNAFSPKDAASNLSNNAPDLLKEADRFGGAVKSNANNSIQDVSDLPSLPKLSSNKADSVAQKVGDKAKEASNKGVPNPLKNSGGAADQVRQNTPNIGASADKMAEYIK